LEFTTSKVFAGHANKQFVGVRSGRSQESQMQKRELIVVAAAAGAAALFEKIAPAK
jgi:H+/Cl- antiporter ClcA